MCSLMLANFWLYGAHDFVVKVPTKDKVPHSPKTYVHAYQRTVFVEQVHRVVNFRVLAALL